MLRSLLLLRIIIFIDNRNWNLDFLTSSPIFLNVHQMVAKNLELLLATENINFVGYLHHQIKKDIWKLEYLSP